MFGLPVRPSSLLLHDINNKPIKEKKIRDFIVVFKTCNLRKKAIPAKIFVYLLAESRVRGILFILY